MVIRDRTGKKMGIERREDVINIEGKRKGRRNGGSKGR